MKAKAKLICDICLFKWHQIIIIKKGNYEEKIKCPKCGYEQKVFISSEDSDDDEELCC